MANQIIELIENGSDILTKDEFVSSYDTDNDGLIDNAQTLQGFSASHFAEKNGDENEPFKVSDSPVHPNDAVSKYYLDSNYAIHNSRIDFGCSASTAIYGGGTIFTNQSNDEVIFFNHKNGAGYNHIPDGGSSGQILKWSANGTAVWDDAPSGGVANDSTITISAGSALSGGGTFTTNQSTNSGVTINHEDVSGTRHIPAGGSVGKVLQWDGDGAAKWETINANANDSTITITAGSNLSGGGSFTTNQASNSGVTINHDTGAGSNHIPTGGSTGQILKWNANGEAVWAAESGGASANDATITLTAGTGITGGGSFTTDQAAAGNITFNHETGSGNNHVPAGGSIGEYLVHDATNNSGVAQWQVATGFMDRTDKDEIVRGVKEFYNSTSMEPSILVTNNGAAEIRAEGEYSNSSALRLVTDVNNDGNKRGGLLLKSGTTTGSSYILGLDGDGNARSWIEMPKNGESKIALKALAVTAHSTAKAYYSGLTDASFIPSQYNVTHIAEVDDSGEYFYDLTINSMHPISYSPNGYPKVMASAMGVKTSDSKPCIGYTIHDPSKDDQNTGSTVRFKFYDDSGAVVRVAALNIVIFATTE